jgi:hypothetical protein
MLALVMYAKGKSDYLTPLAIKPYTITQTKRGVALYTPEEIEKILFFIGTCISVTRRNNQDGYMFFERFILSVL